MTTEEFDNLKIGDNVWIWFNEFDELIKTVVLEEGSGVVRLKTEYNENNGYDIYTYFKVNYDKCFLTEKEAKVFYITSKRKILNNILYETNNEIKNLEEEYSDFIKENIEEFI